ncbi:hypothetical protein BDV96DRAFT_685594 [Lophiotrema nucula]|uniref:Choline monooxygenase, chloroplastic n=1 Tax=Lophiotrema nucula TaxID=690887 RepID=A0A6A5ZGD1_9PLEO|nr:hypothetical protein BDV96DRAFT_685594 [Lophiotrema nucula]
MDSLTRTLPASWYCSSPLYQLERRAVFMKAWYLLGPVTRFSVVGEKVGYEIAQVSLSVLRVSKDPRDIKVFNESTHQEITSYLTETGLLFSTISEEAPSFDEFYADLKPLINTVDFTKRPHRRSIKYEGRFNWKTMVDGYQECLHCQYTHPSFSVFYPPTFYSVFNHKNFSQHIADPKKPDDGLFLYFFPNCTLNVYGGGMSSFRVCPTEKPGITRMEFDYYHMETGEKFEEYFKFVRQVAMEDFELCEKAQENLERGIYAEGILNPDKETGVAFYQQRVLDLVCEQHDAETSRHDSHSPESGNDRNIVASQLVDPASSLFLSAKDFTYAMAPFAETPILSFYRHSPIEVSKEADLLDGWWTSDYLYSLERRAIFSKTWICITHRSRFTKPGDYISLELAGFPILIILGKDHVVRAFHNVCRHRAYTVTKKPHGSSLVLGCRYHGWSYDTKGSLVKAPQFDGIEGFNKSENGLFKIKTCTDRAGFVHINLDAGDYTHVPELEDLLGFANDHGIGPKNSWLLGWESVGAFNWKTVGASDRTGIGTEGPSAMGASIMEHIIFMFRRAPINLGSSKTLYLAPSTMLFAFPKANIWVSCTILPVSATQCTLKCDVFTMKTAIIEDADVEALKIFITTHIHALEQHFDELKDVRPTDEPSLLPYLKAHLKLERLAGREIFPGRKEEGRSESFCKAEKICKELDQLAAAGAGVTSGAGGLEW